MKYVRKLIRWLQPWKYWALLNGAGHHEPSYVVGWDAAERGESKSGDASSR